MKWILPMALFVLGCCNRDEECPVETWSVVAELKEVSDLPTLKEIRPYRDALVARHFRIVSWKGESKPPDPVPAEVAVYHWAILDGKTIGLPEWKVGDVVEMDIQRMIDRKDLKGRYRKNALDDFELQEFKGVQSEGPVP